MRTKLFRRAGYFASAVAWLKRRKGKPVTLHEDAECASLRCWQSPVASTTLAEARGAEKTGQVRLCKRCGRMK